MKFIKLFFWSALTIFFAVLIHSSFKLGSSPIPALGPLFNPVTGFWQNAESVKEYTDIDITTPDIQSPIRVKYDDRMVPHIFAETLEDALFAQGYVEAYHRLFQMDISTRAPAGRLAEVFGKKLIDRDLSSRRLGMGFAAENAVKGWQKHKEHLTLLESYEAGINKYISELSPKDYPFEYKLLGFKPEPWTMLKSAYMLKAMSLVLCGHEEDVAHSNALKLLGPEDFNFIYPEYDPKNNPIIPSGTAWNIDIDTSMDRSVSAVLDHYETDIDRYRAPQGVGSNNWAVNGTKTATGLPIFANDPHLELSLPSVWYELHIHTPEFSAYGVTLLGMPGIMIGFNQDIAWGETNVGHDVMDWHQISWIDSSRSQYMLDNKAMQVAPRIEEIQVKNGTAIIDTVKYTVWGPVAKDTAHQHKDIALHWVAHLEAETPEFLAFIDAMKSQNYDDYLKATANFVAPAQNFAYADRHGEIGLRINGKLPVKKKGQGRLISNGDRSDDGWQEFIPRDKNPQTRNPERGYISSANQWSTDETYPYYYNGNFEGFRGRSVNRLLDSMTDISLTDMMQMQMNNHSIKAEESLPVMLQYLPATLDTHELVQILTAWDFHYTAVSEAPIIYNNWWYYLKEALYDEVLEKNIELPYPDDWRTVSILQTETQSTFWDDTRTDTTETIADIIHLSFKKTMAKMKEYKEKYGDLQYKNFRTVRINHATQIPALSQSGIITDGHGDAINAMRPNMGPSWRMVVGLGEQPQAYGIYPGGQSGNPGSPYYKNMIHDWAQGTHQKLYFPQTLDEMVQHTLFTIEMNPNEK